jgi:hypothetical protein
MTHGIFHVPVPKPVKADEIALVVPDCPRCKVAMPITGIIPHPRFPRVEIVSFQCHCGSMDRCVVAHL